MMIEPEGAEGGVPVERGSVCDTSALNTRTTTTKRTNKQKFMLFFVLLNEQNGFTIINS